MGVHILAIDLGGTNTKMAVFDSKLKVLAEITVPTDAKVDAATAAKAWLIVIAPWMKKYDFQYVGMGSPGPLDSEKGILLNTPNLKNWWGFDFKKFFKKELALPFFLENDANCAALGEWHYHKRLHDLVMITLGTGVGSGVISGGQLVRGVKGLGVEAGHMAIDMNGPVCACGKRGCLEAFVGARSLTDAYNQKSKIKVEPLDAAAVFARAKDDPVAKELIQQWTRALAVGIGNLVNIFNPSLVTLTGGLSRAFAGIEQEFREILFTEAFEPSLKCTKVVVSKLQEKAGLYGAAIWAQQHARH